MKAYKGITSVENNQGVFSKVKNFTDWSKQKNYKVEYVEVHNAPYMVLTDEDGLVTDPQEILKAIKGSKELAKDIDEI